MALFPAAAGYLAKRLGHLLWAAPLLWALSDWVRSWIFTGFPWLTLGYSQAPDSPLAGFLPVLGVYGLSALVMLLAACVFALATTQQHLRSAGILAALLIGGSALTQMPWSQAVGKP
ncbi:conserved hypothetical protein, partial [Ricinus communis]